MDIVELSKKVRGVVKEFIGEDNINYFRETYENPEALYVIYTYKENHCGRQIRNYARSTVPEIDEYFSAQYKDNWYGKFEDWMHEIIVDIIYNIYD